MLIGPISQKAVIYVMYLYDLLAIVSPRDCPILLVRDFTYRTVGSYAVQELCGTDFKACCEKVIRVIRAPSVCLFLSTYLR